MSWLLSPYYNNGTIGHFLTLQVRNVGSDPLTFFVCDTKGDPLILNDDDQIRQLNIAWDSPTTPLDNLPCLEDFQRVADFINTTLKSLPMQYPFSP